MNNVLEELLKKESNQNKFHHTLLKGYVTNLRQEIKNTDFTKVVQNTYQFDESKYTYLDKLNGSGIQAAPGLSRVKEKVLEEEGIYESEKVNGDKEYLLSGVPYDRNGKLIREVGYEHSVEENVYFNTDEKLLKEQWNLIMKAELEKGISQPNLSKQNVKKFEMER